MRGVKKTSRATVSVFDKLDTGSIMKLVKSAMCQPKNYFNIKVNSLDTEEIESMTFERLLTYEYNEKRANPSVFIYLTVRGVIYNLKKKHIRRKAVFSSKSIEDMAGI